MLLSSPEGATFLLLLYPFKTSWISSKARSGFSLYPLAPSPSNTPPVPLSLSFFFLSWVDSPNPDGGVDLLPVPPAAVYGNDDGKLLPNREKNRGGLTLNWVGSTISISTRGAEKPALICGGNVNHFTIRACCSFAFGFSFFPPHKLLLPNI